MNKNFLPIIGAVIAIIGASARQAEGVATCSENAPPNTTCLPVIFHNQSMELVDVSYAHHQEVKTRIPPHEYTTTGQIIVTPYYGGLEKGQSSSINLFEEGATIIRFTNPPGNAGMYFSVKAEGIFTQSFQDTSLKLIIPWECSAESTSLDFPPDTQKPLEVEINTIVNFSTGGCVLEKDRYLCPCDYKITQK